MISIIISEIFDDQFNLFNLFVVLHIYEFIYIYDMCVYIHVICNDIPYIYTYTYYACAHRVI